MDVPTTPVEVIQPEMFAHQANGAEFIHASAMPPVEKAAGRTAILGSRAGDQGTVPSTELAAAATTPTDGLYVPGLSPAAAEAQRAADAAFMQQNREKLSLAPPARR